MRKAKLLVCPTNGLPLYTGHYFRGNGKVCHCLRQGCNATTEMATAQDFNLMGGYMPGCGALYIRAKTDRRWQEGALKIA